MKKNIRKTTPDWNLVQTLPLTLLLVTNLQRGKPIDAAHARTSALYTLCVNLICLAALIVITILRYRASAAAKRQASAESASDEPAIVVRYENTKETVWLVERQSLLRRAPYHVFYAVFGLMAAFVMAEPFHKWNPVAAYAAFPFLWAFGYGAWLVFFLGMTWIYVQQRFPANGASPLCTLSIVPYGLVDQMPDRTVVLTWKQIIATRRLPEALLFMTVLGGVYIPTTAFATPEDADLFYTTAEDLWKGRGTDWDRLSAQWRAHDDPGRVIAAAGPESTPGTA